MSSVGTIARLLKRDAWKPSSSGRRALVAFLDPDEATALDHDPRARAALEELLRKCRLEPSPVLSLLMFIRSDGRSSDRFIEVTYDRRGNVVWNGLDRAA